MPRKAGVEKARSESQPREQASGAPLLALARARVQRYAKVVPTCGAPAARLDVPCRLARVNSVQVVLRRLGRGSRAVTGRLVRAPRKGSVVVVEFSDGMHEYVTTPIRRVLRLASSDVFYVETANSRYRLEVRRGEQALDDVSLG